MTGPVMNRLLFIALAAVGFMSLVAAALMPAGEGGRRDNLLMEAEPGDAAAAEEDTPAMMLGRDSSGQFRVRGLVNGGAEVEFLVDTGADLVALTEADAETLGILPAEDEFQPNMQTAAGVGYGAPVALAELEIAGQRLHDVEAVVMKDLATNLLGQSVLRRLGSVELKGDRMVIRPR